MAGEQGQEISGTWLRGADGGLYFIPDADLETFRIPDADSSEVLQEVDAGGEAEGYAAYESFATLQAVRGPVGIREFAASPTIVPSAPALRALRLG